MSNRSHKQLMSVFDWVGKQHDLTQDYAGKPCVFGVGLPSAIASHRNKMLVDLIETIEKSGEEWDNEQSF